MSDGTEGFVFARFGKRVQAALLDGVAFMPFILLNFIFSRWTYEHRTILPETLSGLAFTSAYVLFVVYAGGTPGKLLVGIRVVDAGGRFLSWSRAIRRELFPNLMLRSIGMIMMWKVVTTFPDGAPISTLIERGELLNAYGKPYVTLLDLLGFTVFLDIGLILFNKKKRAIHDFIAGSYVITKDSYTALSSPEIDAEANLSEPFDEEHSPDAGQAALYD